MVNKYIRKIFNITNHQRNADSEHSEMLPCLLGWLWWKGWERVWWEAENWASAAATIGKRMKAPHHMSQHSGCWACIRERLSQRVRHLQWPVYRHIIHSGKTQKMPASTSTKWIKSVWSAQQNAIAFRRRKSCLCLIIGMNLEDIMLIEISWSQMNDSCYNVHVEYKMLNSLM